MKLMKTFSFITACSLSLLVNSTALAEAQFNKIYADHMVLPQNRPLLFKGTADPSEPIQIEMNGKRGRTKADASGQWQLMMPPQKMNKSGLEVQLKGKANQVTLSNVLIGEVWFCAGQSNMESPINHNSDCKEIIANSTNDQIRVSAINIGTSPTPLSEFKKFNTWRESSPSGLQCGVDGKRYISAVAYCFAREMQKALDCPVGIIVSAWGGTRIDPWTPTRAVAEADGLFTSGGRAKDKASQIYNAMVAPAEGFPISGMLWYQGEANNGDGMKYAEKMKYMVQGWRDAWNQDFPFFYVQIAPYRYPKHKPTDLAWLWGAQNKALDLIKNSRMAIISDLGNFKDVHPIHKPEVARRLSLLARKYVYGERKLLADPPMVAGIMPRGQEIKIKFSGAGKGLKPLDGKPLREFEIAGSDKKWVPATAEISGRDVISLSSDQVSSPKYVRFAWRDTPEINLGNSEGLPTGAFISPELMD